MSQIYVFNEKGNPLSWVRVLSCADARREIGSKCNQRSFLNLSFFAGVKRRKAKLYVFAQHTDNKGDDDVHSDDNDDDDNDDDDSDDNIVGNDAVSAGDDDRRSKKAKGLRS